MTCCCACCAKEAGKEDVPFESPRKCRDVFWLILFIAFVSGLVVVSVFAIIEGDTSRLEHGTDMYGAMCGAQTTINGTVHDHVNEPYLLWPTPLNLSVQVCVPKCPNATIEFVDIALILLPDWTPFMPNRTHALEKLACMDGVVPSRSAVLNGTCFPVYASKPTLGRCIPDFGSFNASEVDRVLTAFFVRVADVAANESIAFNTTASPVEILKAAAALVSQINAREVFTRLVKDIQSSWKLIIILGACSFGVGFLWLLFVRVFAGVIVWIVIVGAMGGMGALTVYVWVISRQVLHSLPADPNLRMWDDVFMSEFLSYVVNALLIADTVFVCCIFFFRRRIKLAVAIVKEATIAVRTLPALVTSYPLFTFLALAVVFGYWIIILLLLATASLKPKLSTTAVFDHRLPHYTLQYCAIYHVFGLFWLTQFVLALAKTSIAGAIGSWYWKKGHPGKCASGASFLRTLWYNAGSVALGSLLIAIVKFLRAMLDYADARKARKQRKLGLGPNAPVEGVFCALRCCLCCFECCLKFLTTYAYIVLAVTGKSLFSAGRQAVATLAKNPIRVSMVNLVSGFFLFLTRICISSLTALVASIVLYNTSGLYYWYIPVIIVFIIAFAVSAIFTSVYEMAVKVILFSFCLDESIMTEAHSDRLLKFMSDKKKQAHNNDIEMQQQEEAASGEPPRDDSAPRPEEIKP